MAATAGRRRVADWHTHVTASRELIRLSSATITAEAEAATAVASDSPTVVSGTATLYMTKSYINNMLANDIVISPVNPWAHSVEATMTTTTWQLKGGDFDLRNGTGFLLFDGSTIVTNVVTGQSLVLWDIRFNLENHTFDYTWKTPDGDVTLHGLDLAGPGQGGVYGTHGSYTCKEVYMSRDNGAAMNDMLKTAAFSDEGLFGSFATTYELREAAPTDGIVKWGLKK